MSGRKLLIEAKQIILKRLDASYPEEITLDDRNIGFFDSMDITPEANRRRSALNDAFTHLKEEGLIQFSSPNNRRPREGLKLTPSGALRVRNPIDAYKQDGIKAALGALANFVARVIEKKFTA
ncbi:hypothetical protein GSUB_06585 [Geoalkalibacter subterraneus]|uniref:Uncharacterized protein n=2 Tax=Geoalkalibacter subterraneus TaxID=483547 RepID=A0A0B5FNR1_9BACT|nr:hypothetical protein GSUB_06585 [Geoalkalibacter subterraneus]